MHQIESMAIRTAKGPLEGGFQIIQPHGILVLASGGTQSDEGYSVGTVFIRNRSRAKLSPHGTEWNAYERGLCSAYRGLLLQIRRSGPEGEIATLANEAAIVGAYLKYLRSLPKPLISVVNAPVGACVSVVERLAHGQAPEKRAAHRNLVRAGQLTDALGRVNIGAAAMAGCLLDLLGGHHHASARVRSLAKEFLREPTEPRRRALRDALGGQIGIFKGVVALPFRRNAGRLLGDLSDAMKLLGLSNLIRSSDCRASFAVLVRRMRQGAAWALALHALEMEIRTPLALLSRGITQCAAVKRAVGASSDRTEAIFNLNVEELSSEVIISRMENFESRIERCSDTELKKKVKQDTLFSLEEARRFMSEERDFAEAETLLRSLADGL